MRAFALILAVALVQGTIASTNHNLFKGLINNVEPRGLEQTINNTLECIKKTLIEGDEEIGITKFVPLIVEEATFDLGDLGLENINGIVNLKDLTVYGIPNWLVSHLKVAITIIPIGAKIEVNMEWPQLDLVGKYDVDSTILGHEIKGAGKIVASATQFSFQLKLHATLKGKQISLKTFNLRPAIEAAALEMDQLSVDGEEKSEIIKEGASNLPNFIKENLDEIEKKLGETVIEFVNGLGAGEEGGEGGEQEPSVIQKLMEKCMK
ncbi:PREDICTED: uncharacterized protein LOC108563667 [Nicrophorus vespilloides]|uniref:Uncharacterized protein LOC108563667 n=1 Tax=Nicrophorus vespilloides TaxID=110193 RepID=A0ABM1MTJ4_NICVS|nr:PREDICTED: uncharacterized protein LOC108563667 [Nicrophorus vespilloides]